MEKKLKQLLPDGHFENVTQKRSYMMSTVRGKNNKSTEMRLKMAMVRMGLNNWKLNNRTLPGKPDIFFPKNLLAIFTDGCYWHGCPKCGHIPKTRPDYWLAKINGNRQRDRVVKLKLKAIGIRSLRIWEHELANRALIDGCILRIIRMLEEPCREKQRSK
jgi:DNA mismatch endonuclease (patch repair protein)